MTRVSFSLIAVLAANGAASALPVVYNGGTPNQQNVYFADTNYGWSTAATIATLSSASTTVTGVQWWGEPTSEPAMDDFTLSIYSDQGGSVGALLNSVALGNGNGTLTGQLIANPTMEEEAVYAATFSTPVTLGAGSYFFALSDNSPPSSTGAWAWETTSGGPQAGGASYNTSNGTWYYSGSENLAFELAGTSTGTSAVVPLPAAAWLLLSGLGGLGLLLRRRSGAPLVSAIAA